MSNSTDDLIYAPITATSDKAQFKIALTERPSTWTIEQPQAPDFDFGVDIEAVLFSALMAEIDALFLDTQDDDYLYDGAFDGF